ncbi:MAG TPA: hypothetical protein PLG99_05105 [Kaistiaceae bacterium]|nr:hypothetical protein [Kaistiaceae bacterium]
MAWKTTYYPIPPRPIYTDENSTPSEKITIKETVHYWVDEIPDIDSAIQAEWSHQDNMREKQAAYSRGATQAQGAALAGHGLATAASVQDRHYVSRNGDMADAAAMAILDWWRGI